MYFRGRVTAQSFRLSSVLESLVLCVYEVMRRRYLCVVKPIRKLNKSPDRQAAHVRYGGTCYSACTVLLHLANSSPDTRAIGFEA